jgi:UDP-2-acetamido-3-amino-2,3-dideoxy-glucuronate N-acetyltransferase
MTPESVRIHPTALVEEGVVLGGGTSVWDNVHIRRNTVIGEHCIVGEKTYIAYDVKIGSGVKINSYVYICTGVTIEDGVMIAAGTIFTNDQYPRAFEPDDFSVRTSEPTEETLQTVVRRGVTIGAGCIIGPGVELGEFSMIGMGSVVTRDVKPFELVYGNPARPVGHVCLCGQPLVQGVGKAPARKASAAKTPRSLSCSTCLRRYARSKSGISLKG